MGDKIVFPYKQWFFDSREEVWFAKWCEELRQAGYIASWEQGFNWVLTGGLKMPYVKVTQLKTKIKEEQKELKLLNPSEYTSDLAISWTEKGFEKFVGLINTAEYRGNVNAIFFNTSAITHVEVKPTWDQNNMTRLFVNNQKFMWDKHRIFINLIKPEDLFKETFMPVEVMSDFKIKKLSAKLKTAGKKVGDWKTNYTPKTIKEFLNGK